MRIKRLAEDFKIEELVELPDEDGAYAYYRVEKHDKPAGIVRDGLAKRLKVTSSSVTFLSTKGKGAFVTQYASVRKRGPEMIEGDGFKAELVSRGSRALRDTDLQGHHFSIVVRDLDAQQAGRLGALLHTIATVGLPNYFDMARFGSYSEEGFIGKAILMREAEHAVRLYLSTSMAADSRDIRDFKHLVRTHWGQWGYLLHQAPRPSNFRSVLTFLKDHPQEFRKALNLIQDRMLFVYLEAFQAWLWNAILGQYLEESEKSDVWLEIAGRRLPLPEALSSVSEDFELSLPNLTAVYPPEFAPVVEAVLAENGMTSEDFKARVLRRVYLPKGDRRIWFAPSELEVQDPVPDELFQDRWRVLLSFTLTPEHYATLILKAAAARLGVGLRGH